MIAKKCDRCGQFYTELEETGFDFAVRQFANMFKSQTQIKIEEFVKEFDFCAECQKSLIEWFNNEQSKDDKGGVDE